MSRAVLIFYCAQIALGQTVTREELADRGKAGMIDGQVLTGTLGADALAKGTAVATRGGTFLFAVQSATEPQLYVDFEPVSGKMKRVASSDLWWAVADVSTGTSHAFHYIIDGKKFGGSGDVPAYLPECYEVAGVPQGKLTEKRVHTSKIYDGMKSDYWVFVPAQYDPSNPAALVVWQDGEEHTRRGGRQRTLTVIENLTHQKRIPVAVYVFIQPGLIGERRMRSIQYDTPTDTYARFLRDEVLPEVAKEFPFRQDGYSHAIAGSSSGGICAFNAAWHFPQLFSRVMSFIGSFTSISWRREGNEGGHVYPFLIRRDPKRNIRVWLSDGSEDLENQFGSWPLQNLQMANSLKRQGYDFTLSWSSGSHNGAHRDAELPRTLEWIWRGYDPAKTEETFVQDPAEKDRPFFRVKPYGR